jgi:hypothetical protein
MCLTSYSPKVFGRFQSVARSGQESIAQGLYVFGARYTPRRTCPEGATGLSPGFQPRFQPWEPNTPEQRALKGRQVESSYNAEVRSNYSTSQLTTLILRNDGCEIHLVSCRPFRAKRLFWGFPGLKPWAKSCCPFGASPSGGMIMRLNRYKPWANLSCPFGAGLLGSITGAKHKQSLGN